MKRTDLEKFQAKKILNQLQHTAVPERYAQGSAAVADRRERQRLARERGLIPFAVKLDRELAARLRQTAEARGVALDVLVGDLLAQGLDADGTRKA